MGVAVLSPENCLQDGFQQHRRLISPPRSKPLRSAATHVPNRRRKQYPSQSKPANDGKTFPAKNPAINGQVRILKRGEELTPTQQSIVATTPAKDRKTKRVGSVDRPAPNPNPISGFYAGSASFTSPPPSSVPLPAFCSKKTVSFAGAGAGGLTNHIAEDVAVDLRRILRLE